MVTGVQTCALPISVLPGLLRWLGEERIPWQVLGGGSNILFKSGLHEGVFLRLKGSQRDLILREDPAPEGLHLVDVQAGIRLSRLLGWCAQQGLSGLEFMTGIPGTIGSAVAMNAGAFGGCMGDRLVALRCLNARGEAASCPPACCPSSTGRPCSRRHTGSTA